jgi:putative ABC transport system permease protein
MSVLEMFRVAYHGLAANKLRSFLTMLGVIIGVASVIVMVALGQGVADASRKAIQKLGTNRLFVRPENRRVGGVNQGADSGISLTLRDVEILKKESKYAAAVAPEFRGSRSRVKYRNTNTLTDVTGSTPEYFQIRSMSIEEGRLFTHEEVERRARVAVLGSEVWHQLFGRSSPIGKTIRINGQPFVVVGRLKSQGAMPFANKDDEIAIPISTAMRRLYGADGDRIRSMSVQAVSSERMKDLEEEIFAILGKAHKLKEGDPPDIRIHNQADLIESADEQSGFLTMLLAGVALVSLVVGGIGIMNIMLVSVTERTREIGIRKALGAKRKHILYQFLIESVTLSLGGGVLGVLLGIGVSWWMSLPADEGGAGFPMLLSLPPIVVSFGFSGFVGVFFGIYPAVKASGLNPIEALRYE